jgi:hypothetical protein
MSISKSEIEYLKKTIENLRKEEREDAYNVYCTGGDEADAGNTTYQIIQDRTSPKEEECRHKLAVEQETYKVNHGRMMELKSALGGAKLWLKQVTENQNKDFKQWYGLCCDAVFLQHEFSGQAQGKVVNAASRNAA